MKITINIIIGAILIIISIAPANGQDDQSCEKFLPNKISQYSRCRINQMLKDKTINQEIIIRLQSINSALQEKLQVYIRLLQAQADSITILNKEMQQLITGHQSALEHQRLINQLQKEILETGYEMQLRQKEAEFTQLKMIYDLEAQKSELLSTALKENRKALFGMIRVLGVVERNRYTSHIVLNKESTTRRNQLDSVLIVFEPHTTISDMAEFFFTLTKRRNSNDSIVLYRDEELPYSYNNSTIHYLLPDRVLNYRKPGIYQLTISYYDLDRNIQTLPTYEFSL